MPGKENKLVSRKFLVYNGEGDLSFLLVIFKGKIDKSNEDTESFQFRSLMTACVERKPLCQKSCCWLGIGMM